MEHEAHAAKHLLLGYPNAPPNDGTDAVGEFFCDAGFLNDLLPVPYTAQSLARICDHIDEVQDTLAHQMLLENPSTYVAFAESTYDEIDFISEIVARTGCGLLFDVNNVFVASTNQEWSPINYVNRYPLSHVREIHLAGFTPQTDDAGRPLLIDTHDRPVEDVVWDLYRQTISLTGPIPTLIEWDADVPDWKTLFSEAQRAEAIMVSSGRMTNVAARA